MCLKKELDSKSLLPPFVAQTAVFLSLRRFISSNFNLYPNYHPSINSQRLISLLSSLLSPSSVIHSYTKINHTYISYLHFTAMPTSPSISIPSLSIPSHTAATSPLPSSPSIGTSSQDAHGDANASAVAPHVLPLPPPAAPISSACAACKYQRRKCGPQCMLAPYFPPDRQADFQNAHRLFGVSNIVKKLRMLSPDKREDAINSMVFEANRRAVDPSGGCVRIICGLQSKLRDLEEQLAFIRAHLALYRGGHSNLETSLHEQPDNGPY